MGKVVRWCTQFPISKSYVGVRSLKFQVLKVVPEVPGTCSSRQPSGAVSFQISKVVPEVPGTQVKSATFCRSYRRSYLKNLVRKSSRHPSGAVIEGRT